MSKLTRFHADTKAMLDHARSKARSVVYAMTYEHRSHQGANHEAAR